MEKRRVVVGGTGNGRRGVSYGITFHTREFYQKNAGMETAFALWRTRRRITKSHIPALALSG
jgi:hypothetical protein